MWVKVPCSSTSFRLVFRSEIENVGTKLEKLSDTEAGFLTVHAYFGTRVLLLKEKEHYYEKSDALEINTAGF